MWINLPIDCFFPHKETIVRLSYQHFVKQLWITFEKRSFYRKNSVIKPVKMTFFCLLQTKILIIMVSTTLNHRKFLKLQIKAN